MEGPWHAAGPKRLFFCRHVIFGKRNFKTNSANFFIMANLGPHLYMGQFGPKLKIQKEGSTNSSCQKNIGTDLHFQNCKPGPRTEAVPIKAAKKNRRLQNCRPGPRREAAPTKAEQIQAPTISELQTWKGGSTNSRYQK